MTTDPVAELTARISTTCHSILTATAYAFHGPDPEGLREALAGASKATDRLMRQLFAEAVDLGTDDAALTEQLTRMRAVNRAVQDLRLALG